MFLVLVRVCRGSGAQLKERRENENPTSKSGNRLPKPSHPLILLPNCFPKKREREIFCLCSSYFRLLRISAAATATMTTTATPTATYVVVGSALVGGVTAELAKAKQTAGARG